MKMVGCRAVLGVSELIFPASPFLLKKLSKNQVKK
jgi:hypothetical protein